MKLNLTIFFTLVSLVSFAQLKLKGEYCSPGGYSSYCINFKNDSLFEYTSNSCTRSGEGYGIYKLNKKKLSLYFTTSDTLQNSFTTNIIKCNSKDSIRLTFTVIDRLTNQLIPKANIWISDTSETKIDTLTDIRGNLTVTLHKSIAELNVYTTCDSCNRYKYEVKTDNCMDIQVYIIKSFTYYIKGGTVWEYEIIKEGSEEIHLRKEDNYVNVLKKD